MTPAAPAGVWRALGADAAASAELERYAASRFDGLVALPSFPLDDESFVGAWKDYQHDAERDGAAAVLSRVFVQLAFPVAEGMSSDAGYLAATRRGDAAAGMASATHWADAEGVQLRLHATAAGVIPVVITRARPDFELLIRALTRHNEPALIPASMGACIIGGYNNWDRIRRWRAGVPARTAGFPADKRDFQDRFIVLSAGPYSGVPAAALGLDTARWDELSLAIRLEHECAHYFTRRVLGAMTNSLLDELIADFAGLVAATGRYNAEWARCFLGIEASGALRAGGRLENYRGAPPLGEAAYAVLRRAVVVATNCLERFDAARRAAGASRDALAMRAHLLLAIAGAGLAELLVPSAPEVLMRRLHALRGSSPDGIAVADAITASGGPSSREQPWAQERRVQEASADHARHEGRDGQLARPHA